MLFRVVVDICYYDSDGNTPVRGSLKCGNAEFLLKVRVSTRVSQFYDEMTKMRKFGKHILIG